MTPREATLQRREKGTRYGRIHVVDRLLDSSHYTGKTNILKDDTSS